MKRKRAGSFFIEKNVLTHEQVHRIVKYSRRRAMRFDEAAMQLGYINKETLVEMFGPNYKVDVFYLDPQEFPPNTYNLLTKEEIIRLGALPLGFTMSGNWFRPRKVLNLGILNPLKQDALKEIQQVVDQRTGGKAFGEIKVYLVVADQFVTVLEQVYSVSVNDLAKQDPTRVDETLRAFLQKQEARNAQQNHLGH